VTGSRAAVVIVENGRVALIRRVRAGRVYYLFPGGRVEEGESLEEAAVREAREELGVEVELDGIVHEERFGGIPMRYFRARITGGEFGTGLWPDHAAETPLRREKSGTHEAVWLELTELPGLEVRPPELVAKLLSTHV